MKGLLFLYIIFTAIVSLMSYKKGIYLIWLTFLFVPTIILEQSIIRNISLETILMLGSVISELRYSERRNLWKQFVSENQKAIIVYFFISFAIILMSQTVPISTQIKQLFGEIVMLLFALQTFMLVKNEIQTSSVLFRILSVAIVFNVVYCVIFEVLMGMNPAGMPLYILMGVDDNQFIVDMIELERGNLSFRAQTVYRHPLSLGQYMLVMLPLFMTKGKRVIHFALLFFACGLIVLSGSRGAIVPMVLILLLSAGNYMGNFIPKFVVLIIACVVGVSFLSDLQKKKLEQKIEPLVAGMQFWDDSKQYSNNISGSSMQMRIDQFDAALDEIEENPIFGRGYGYRDYWMYLHNDLHPKLLGFESVLLLYLVERGWLGLLFFFIMAFYIFKLLSEDTSDEATMKYVFIGYIISIIMTGVRPLTLLFVCLTCSIAYGLAVRQEEQQSDVPELQEPEIV